MEALKIIDSLLKNFKIKGKLKPVQPLTEDQINQPYRFTNTAAIKEWLASAPTCYYISVKDSLIDHVHPSFQEKMPDGWVAYIANHNTKEGDNPNTRRIVFMPTTNDIDILKWQGVYSEEDKLSNEAIVSWMQQLKEKYPIQIDEATVNTIGCSLTEALKKNQAETLATLLFNFNNSVVDFQSDEEETGYTYETHKDYYIKKLQTHLLTCGNFFLQWY